MGKLRLVEYFVSINGEGQRAGELALFFRFAGCNLNCSYCDTKWANEENAEYICYTADELVRIAKYSCIKNVTLTGGEPLLQDGITELIEKLQDAGHTVEIETNGSVPLFPLMQMDSKRPCITMDYKLPSSGMESEMSFGNISMLEKSDTLKFVCGSRWDLSQALDIIKKYNPACAVYFSPVFGCIEPAEIVEFMKEHNLNDVRLQLQLHKFVWSPEMRGV